MYQVKICTLNFTEKQRLPPPKFVTSRVEKSQQKTCFFAKKRCAKPLIWIGNWGKLRENWHLGFEKISLTLFLQGEESLTSGSHISGQ